MSQREFSTKVMFLWSIRTPFTSRESILMVEKWFYLKGSFPPGGFIIYYCSHYSILPQLCAAAAKTGAQQRGPLAACVIIFPPHCRGLACNSSPVSLGPIATLHKAICSQWPPRIFPVHYRVDQHQQVNWKESNTETKARARWRRRWRTVIALQVTTVLVKVLNG